ncbi:MAG TPA: iron ABC transporter permease [Bacillales bacterium]|nr:iron ABC transporter permease [Bacillales bacterium]
MQGTLKNNLAKASGFVIAALLVIGCMIASIVLGLTDVSLQMVIDTYTDFNGSNEQLIIRNARVPRAFIAAAVGASLAVSGVMMQGLTRNPLASPNILGVNQGAGFFIVAAVAFFGVTSLTAFTWLAFLGAALAQIIVYSLGSLGSERLTPVKLTLAGAAMAAFFSSVTQGMLALNEKTLETVLFWLVGSVQGRDLNLLISVLPYLAAGWILSMAVSAKMNTLALGDKVAKGLGLHTWIIKGIIGIVVILLAGGSVAIAGPVGFIGIVIPHMARWLVGQDFRWLIPYSAMLGAILLLLADIGARYVIMPSEVPVGIMTAVIGTPFFIYIARKGDFSS